MILPHLIAESLVHLVSTDGSVDVDKIRQKGAVAEKESRIREQRETKGGKEIRRLTATFNGTSFSQCHHHLPPAHRPHLLLSIHMHPHTTHYVHLNALSVHQWTFLYPYLSGTVTLDSLLADQPTSRRHHQSMDAVNSLIPASSHPNNGCP